MLEFKKILSLYKGELLEGFYTDWALRERERLRTLYIRSLIYLLQYHSFHHAYEQAIAYCQQILVLDPLREEIHREMMRLYMANGQRTQAVRQYEICHSTMAKELGILPMEETQVIYRNIIADHDDSHSSLLSNKQKSVDQAMSQLNEAQQTIELAKEQIQQALQLIAQYSEHAD